ncbi:MAG: hypothetical protein VCD34_08430 [Planctomycetota bacterium]
MAKLLIILLLSTLFINTATFLVVLSDDPGGQEAVETVEKPDPAAVLKPEIQKIGKQVESLSRELRTISASQKSQLSGISKKVQTLEATVKALSEPVEGEEPAENTGNREFKESRAPADGK